MCLALVHILMDDGPLLQSNGLDNWILRKLRSKSPWHVGAARRAFWRPILQKVILNLSDQQLLFGIAILLAGLAQHCTISEYHFTMVLNLAWFSSSVHITTLAVLQKYLRDTPKLRNWRVCLMVVMFALMVVYTVLTAHNAWDDSAPYPAECLFSDVVGNVSGTAAFWLSFDLSQIIRGYCSGVFSLYGSVSSSIDSWVIEKPISMMEKGIKSLRQWKRKTMSRSYSVFHIPRAWTLTVAERSLLLLKYLYSGSMTLGDSQWANLLFSLAFFAYGLCGMIRTRNISSSDMTGNENQLTFGQIVPLLMLASTMVVFKEALEGKKHNKKCCDGVIS